MKKYHLIPILTVIAITVKAQDIYSPVLEQIDRNSHTLHLYEKEYRSALAENATGLAPINPEVEFGYLWGDRLTGNRKDVSVKQSFDFPTVYIQRNRLSHDKNNSASCLWKAQRLDLLLEAKELLVQLVYYNAMYELCSTQFNYAKEIMKSYERLKELGEASQIDYNKASMNYTNFENELGRISVERKNLIDRLTMLNGGNPITFDNKEFSNVTLPADFEQWFTEAEQNNPALLYLKSQIEVSQRNVSLAKASNMPKLSVGYMGEFVRGANFQGVTVGVSIPLWENRNKVRHAKAQTAVAEEAMTDAREDYYHNLQSLFNQARTFGEMERRYLSSLKDASNNRLLYTAYFKGQLTLLEYVTEVQYYFTMSDKLLQTQRDRELALARLYSFKL